MTRDQARAFISWVAGLRSLAEVVDAPPVESIPGADPESVAAARDHVTQMAQAAKELLEHGAPAAEIIETMFFGRGGEGLAVKTDKASGEVIEVYKSSIIQPRPKLVLQ